MRVPKRLILVGVLVIVLNMTIATQFATTKIGYSYSIVHPSNADIRFIGSSNNSDMIRVLRVLGDNETNKRVQLKFGNLTAGNNNTFTAAFGIVNEERYSINITHINVSHDGYDYMKIWLHGNRDERIEDDPTSVMVWNEGSLGYDHNSCLWKLAAGDQDASNMNGTIPTGWDSTAGVRYSMSNTNAQNGTSDFVWFQISMNCPLEAVNSTRTGSLYIHTSATTHD